MNRLVCSYLISSFILTSFLSGGIYACWGNSAPKYGDMTKDYDLMVGSDLILNCTLRKRSFTKDSKMVSSSDLVIEKENQDLTKFTQVIDDHTIQLKIPKATVNDSGMYMCKILANDTKPVVCPSQVNVGYPPLPLKKFSCVIRNFDKINCTWSMDANNVFTTYTIRNRLFNIDGYEQRCPNSTVKSNSCEWSDVTEPQFQPISRNYSFIIIGNNTLGESLQYFEVDSYSIVIPNSPRDLEVLNITEQTAFIRWKSPYMKNYVATDFAFRYRIWISKVLYDSSEFTIYDVENNTSFLLENLIPHVMYNVSIRCQSIYVEEEEMWSNFTSLLFNTSADVPYEIPEVISEAFESHIFGNLRSATLYWKAVPKLHRNGDMFHYHVKYFQSPYSNTSEIYTLNTNVSSINIKNLKKNTPYEFQIYSANEKGISENYRTIIIDSQDKIPPAPREVRVISQDTGRYNLTWIPPNYIDTFQYVVLWCSSLKPWLSRCDNSIEWINGSMTETNLVLNISDVRTNYQFAVVSKTETGSSSMEWASCILPHKGGLSKIRHVFVVQKSSTALKVIWNLDCPAEKSVLNSYKITYCGVDRDKKCRTANVEPDADNFLLENLHPYTNYSVKIRALNSHNKSSEDSDEVYQSTLPGAPSGPPQNIHVSSSDNDTFFVCWEPPLEPNGIITSYNVFYNNSKIHIEAIPGQNDYNIRIDALNPYSKYAVRIEACVKIHCSNKSEPIWIYTDVAEPGYMQPPRIEEENSTHFRVSWAKPNMPNGPIDFYEITWHPEKQNVSVSNNTLEVAGAISVIIDVKCPSLGDEARKYLFYVRAVNKKNDGTKLYGPYSESTQVKACQMPEGLGMIIGTIVGAAFCAIFFLVLIYRFAVWMKIKIHQVQSIAIRLPDGLEGPETNPLNNYECFKNGLNGNLKSNNGERLSYIIDENKNRHGSGSSQFSNSSAEEIYKNGRCVKFGRKPSGDSSGCSSMSSSITPRTHLSSGTDSGTESDFVIPPSPDSAVTEPSLLNAHKAPLPILVEAHDQNSSEKNEQQTSFSTKHLDMHKNKANDIILKVDSPYSKFGYAGNASSSLPWRVNPLIFYNCNLANSEPSVFDNQIEEKNETVLAPYSKVGLAKSSGDIGLVNAKENGYSKFGLPTSPKRFSIPPPNLNPIAMIMLENPDKKEWPAIKKLLDDKYSQQKINNAKSQMTPSDNLVEDTGYIKVRKNKICNKPSKGYVPFHEVRNQMDHNQSYMVDNNDHAKVYNNSLNANDQTYFPDDTEWPPFNHQEEESSNIDASDILFDTSFSQNSADCMPLDGNVFIANNYGCSPLGCQNPNDSLPILPSEPEIKLGSDSPVLSLSEINFENNSFLQHQTDLMPNSILNTTGGSLSAESHSCENANNSIDSYDIPNEVIMTPVTLKNGYVPFHSLSDSMCDKTLSSLPNNSKLTHPQNYLSDSSCPLTPNYKTSKNNADCKFSQHDSLSTTVPFVTPVKTDSLNGPKKGYENTNGYSSLSLNYVLKPLPKMESEICEV